MSPSLENTILFLWLQLIHRDLPHLVKQRYGTLASIKPEISQALSSLLDELNSVDEGRVMRMSGNQNFQRRSHPPRKAFQHQNNKSYPTTRRTKPVCPICKEARYSRVDHFLSSCPYLPESDKKYLARTRLIHSLEDEDNYYREDDYDDKTSVEQVDAKTDIPPPPPPPISFSKSSTGEAISFI